MWVKVCGLRTVENALQVAAAGVDAIGLNFYSKSKRYITPQAAKKIVAALPTNVMSVGLFVNHSADEVLQIAEETGIKTLQFHGDESPDFVAQFRDFQIIKAFRVDSSNIEQLQAEVESYRTAGIKLFGCLIDAKVSDAYGGTGQTAPWDILRQNYNDDNLPVLILAGGLTANNVREAVNTVQPWGVDTASGVESAPGIKDSNLTQRFVQLAHSNRESLS